MCIYKVTDRASIAPLFGQWEETFIWSYLQGCMGSAYACGKEIPVSAAIESGDFCCFAGIPDRSLIENAAMWEGKKFLIYVPQNEAWEKMIEAVCGNQAIRRERYAVKKEGDIFDREKLVRIIEAVELSFELRMIDEPLYHSIRESDWAMDLCSQFACWQDYEKWGLGVVMLENGELVSGASSYIMYQGGIEIEIDTREDKRRKGMALACGAKLILECLERGLYPSWDAHNMGSLKLAEKLGYHFDKAYTAYDVIKA